MRNSRFADEQMVAIPSTGLGVRKVCLLQRSRKHPVRRLGGNCREATFVRARARFVENRLPVAQIRLVHR